jgi:DNA (cytosine-5)-methyltransferase 1
LNGLDLFSGIGGLTLGLSEFIRPIAYCEQDKYCQAVLMSRMSKGEIGIAPIWDDVRTLRGDLLADVDIIYGGFPCQDISVAGNGAGMGGERSGLFFEILRLAKEIKPQFIFLENVPAIRTRGLEHVAEGLASAGYDCRWDIVSAQEVGAPHIRKRWFLLAHAHGMRLREKQRSQHSERKGPIFPDHPGQAQSLANPQGSGFESLRSAGDASLQRSNGPENFDYGSSKDGSWWSVEPDVGRVADGVPFRVDRLRGLGNAVVPAQAREAFMRLSGLNSSYPPFHLPVRLKGTILDK